jgi:biotin operon repressor
MSLGHQHHEAVNPVIDEPRLLNQFARVMQFMSDGQWHSKYDIAKALGIGDGSAASQLRNARVDGCEIEKKRSQEKSGLWLYRLKTNQEQGRLI